MVKRCDLPRISIVTPSFNQGLSLERTIRSVLDQNYPNLEFIVVDGGSTDGSVEIIKRFESQLAYWVSEPDTGQANAINKGLARATGTILAWLNSDDCHLPGALEIVAEAAVAHPEAEVFVGGGDTVDLAGNILYHKAPSSPITRESLHRWMDGGDFMQPSCVFREKAWRRVGSLDETIHIALDLDLWLRMEKAGSTFLTIDRLLSRSLSHPEAKTTMYRNLMRVDAAIVLMRHGGERAARMHLEQMAMRLAWAEPNLEKILEHPIVRILGPLAGVFLKPAVRRRDTAPPWLQR